ncbi:MAG: hypothetical protein JSW00_19150, partial [Thermoplasmata archaeon]
VGYLIRDKRTGDRKKVVDIPKELGSEQIAGPLWIGDIHDRTYLKNMKLDESLGTNKRLKKYLELWIEEAEMPPYFYDQNEVASLTKTQPLSLDDMMQRLKKHGFSACKTHFSPTGFKTDAEMDDIRDLVEGTA